jgi:hypothetical protein
VIIRWWVMGQSDHSLDQVQVYGVLVQSARHGTGS